MALTERQKERLKDPALQKELAREKAQAIASAERRLEKAKAEVKEAEKALALAQKENA